MTVDTAAAGERALSVDELMAELDRLKKANQKLEADLRSAPPPTISKNESDQSMMLLAAVVRTIHRRGFDESMNFYNRAEYDGPSIPSGFNPFECFRKTILCFASIDDFWLQGKRPPDRRLELLKLWYQNADRKGVVTRNGRPKKPAKPQNAPTPTVDAAAVSELEKQLAEYGVVNQNGLVNLGEFTSQDGKKVDGGFPDAIQNKLPELDLVSLVASGLNIQFVLKGPDGTNSLRVIRLTDNGKLQYRTPKPTI